MENLKAQLHKQIFADALQTPEGVVDTILRLWEALAVQLVPIIGDDGFQSLLDRCLHLTSKQFPWLAMNLHAWDHSDRFSGLRENFNSRNPDEAAAAGLALLTSFIETLVQLIDVPLVSNVLRAAWR